MRPGLAGVLMALLLGLAGPAGAGPFSDWAAIVVAGDWRGSNGGPTEAFDNARRDVAKALTRMGFEAANIREFSVRPGLYENRPLKAEPRTIFETLGELSARAKGGCLVYFTSHGAPQGVVLDEQILPPRILGRMLDETCGARPTVVIMSACFSGVFVRPLAQPNRMILTAARPDRASFGCGETNRYPYFDDCVLSTSGRAKDFPGLASAVRGCVAEREAEEGMEPPSEPQVWIGPALRPVLPLYPFANGSPGG